MEIDVVRHFEQRVEQLEKEGTNDFDIVEAMTDMETEFQIPLLENPSWNKENPRIIGIYRKLSSLQQLQG